MDTLDYSGGTINEGSKLVIAAAGPPKRALPTDVGDWSLPAGFGNPRLCLPGVLVIAGPCYRSADSGAGGPDTSVERFCRELSPTHPLNRFPLVVVADDADFTAASLDNFLWVTFTRSNPAADVQGIDAGIEQKHWGCRGSLVIDARGKPHHAPPLVEDALVTRRVDALAARGGPLAGIL
jgi:4-hydroxy-3-polyprenylbenzoate decarboxylase